jgi:hypothetical protein
MISDEEDDDVVFIEVDDSDKKQPNNVDEKKIDNDAVHNETSDGQECPICLEPCSLNGEHRASVTRCGHIFGRNCIINALRSKWECPTCRKPVRKKELIQIYDCKVVALDTSVVDTLSKQLEEERNQRIKVVHLQPLWIKI